MCETIAKVVVALNIGMNVSLFIHQVNTTEKWTKSRSLCYRVQGLLYERGRMI